MREAMLIQLSEAGPLDGKEIWIPEAVDRFYSTEWSGNCITIAPKPGEESPQLIEGEDEPRVIDVAWIWTGRISARGARIFERERSTDAASGEV
jgi:hypothetical protein